MTREETKKAIEVMQAYVDGKKIECRWKAEEKDEWRGSEDPLWLWDTRDYRIKPQPMKVTEEERELIRKEPLFWAKDKETGKVNSYWGHPIGSFRIDHYILNTATMEWEDWSEDRERLKHLYNGGQP